MVRPAYQLLGRLKQEDLKFKASLGKLSRPCLKNKEEEEKKHLK